MPSIKNIIIFAAIGLSLVLVYVFFIKSDGEEENLISNTSDVMPAAGTPTGSSGVSAGQDFLTLLLNVKNIKLDHEIFSSAAFKSLHDSSIILVPDGNEGRPNPFAPIGVDVVAVPASTTTTPVSPDSGAPNSTTPPTSTTPPIPPTGN